MKEKIEKGITIAVRIIAVLFCIQPFVIYALLYDLKITPLFLIFLSTIFAVSVGFGLIIWFFAPKLYIKMYHKTINRNKS